MELGFVSAILGDLSIEEVVGFASRNGFSCVEMMCWPKGQDNRRYAGITHIDVSNLDQISINNIRKLLTENGVVISALGYYPNPLDPEIEKRQVYIEHIKKVIEASNKLGINCISTFIGRDPGRPVEENFEIFQDVWPSIVSFAEQNKVKIGNENCPMLFTQDEWPGGKNLATTPEIWRRIFKEIPSEYFGLSYDPSHFIWQQMDYIKPIYEFKEKLFLVHIKDVKVNRYKLDEVGIMATPLEYSSPKLPGLGDVDWGGFVSALTDIGYRGPACIEVEDKAFEDTIEEKKKALLQSQRYISQFIAKSTDV